MFHGQFFKNDLLERNSLTTTLTFKTRRNRESLFLLFFCKKQKKKLKALAVYFFGDVYK